jgi:hypothetical protein
MTLVELCASVGMAVGIAFAGLAITNNQAALLREQAAISVYTTALPAVRSLLNRTAGKADRCRVFSSLANARTTTGDTGVALTGPALRLEYLGGPNVPAGNTTWQATVEFRATERTIVYRNQGGKEWVVCTGIDQATFSITDGACVLGLVRGGRSCNIVVAIN